MKKTFIPLTALALLALVSCGGNAADSSNTTPADSSTSSVEPSASSSSDDVVANSVTIANKDVITAEWYVGNANRTLDITLDPEGNVNALINSGKLKITSSNASVVSVTGRVLRAVSAGTATITVTYGNKTDSVDVTVKAEQTAIEEWGTVHAGTEADPLDNEDAVKVATATGTTSTTKYYYVKGTISSFRDAPSDYGNVSYYLTPSTASGKSFLVFRATLIDGGKVTDNDVWVGAIVTAKVKIVNYNNEVPETEKGGEITKVEGTKPAPVTDITATVAEAVAACQALADNTSSTAKYIITGYIVAKTSKGFYMSDTKGEITPTNDDFLVYGWSGDTAEQCTINAKVKVTATIKNYKSSSDATNYAYETGSITSVEILEEGDAPAAIESINVESAITKINALADGATSSEQYDLTGYVVSITSAYSSQYGNISFTVSDEGGTDTVTVFRAKLGTGVSSDDIDIGSKVVVRGYLQKYVSGSTTTPEFVSGSITSATPPTTPVVTPNVTATVAEAITAAKAVESGSSTADTYEITGYVTKISGAYSSSYGNMSFYMSDTIDDFYASFIAYQVKCDADVAATIVTGAKVKVTGKLSNYNGTPETVGKGAASVELVAAPTADAVEATIDSDTIVKNKTAQITVTDQEGVTFTYSSSDTSVATVSEAGLVTGVAAGTAVITISASTGRKAYIEVTITANEAYKISGFSEVSGDFGETGYTYTSDKGKASTAPAVNGDAIRLYQNGATFTIAGADTSKALTSIQITTDGNSDGEGPFSYVSGTSATTAASATATTVATWTSHTNIINFDADTSVKYFKLTTTGTDKKNRVYIKEIILTFAD